MQVARGASRQSRYFQRAAKCDDYYPTLVPYVPGQFSCLERMMRPPKMQIENGKSDSRYHPPSAMGDDWSDEYNTVFGCSSLPRILLPEHLLFTIDPLSWSFPHQSSHIALFSDRGHHQFTTCLPRQPVSCTISQNSSIIHTITGLEVRFN